MNETEQRQFVQFARKLEEDAKCEESDAGTLALRCEQFGRLMLTEEPTRQPDQQAA